MKNLIAVVITVLTVTGIAGAVSVETIQLGQGPISAETTDTFVNVKSLGMNASAGVQGYYNPTAGKKGKVSYDKWNGSAGEYNYDLHNNRKNVTWSVELYQPMGTANQHSYEHVIVTDQNYIDTVDKLFAQYLAYTDAVAGDIPALGIAAAAMQLALWEVTYETGEYDMGSGWFYTKSDDESELADDWLAALGDVIAPEYEKEFYINNDLSDLLVFPGNGGGPGLGGGGEGGGSQTPSVPEPLTMLGIGLGCAGLGGYLRKRIKNK